MSLQRYLQTLIIKSYETFSATSFQNFSSSTNNYYELYDCLTEWACHSRIERCLKNTAQAFERFMNEKEINIQLQQLNLIRKYGILRGNTDISQRIWYTLEVETNENERTKIIEAIMMSDDESFIKDVLNSIINKNDQACRFMYSKNDRQQILKQFILKNLNLSFNIFTVKYLINLTKM